MFTKQNLQGYIQPIAGVEQKTLTYGEKTLLTEFLLKQGHTLPRHSHPNEQIGYLVKGRIILSIADQVYETVAGDSWCIPGNVEHSAEIIEDSIAIEVFSPVREDYLPKTISGLQNAEK
jgi:quercetin dioxygenase-like cupin family protein